MLLLLLTALCPTGHATESSKRGLAYTGDSNEADLNLLVSAQSPISWYYTWSLNQASGTNNTVAFVPLIHNTDDASNSNLNSLLSALPSSSTHVLSFNEPDGTTDSGGSSIEPEDAAQSYLDHIAPLRTSGSRSWNISWPSVTGSTQGLDWLQRFNESCYDLDPDGCPMDFVAVHWYGDFSGLASWLGTLQNFYVANATDPDAAKDLKFWITEMALPQQDEDATVSMMNQSLSYLDGLDYIESYAWFGAFRSDDSNEWTGSSVALFDDDGGLTEVGSLYLGGEENGFAKGTKGEGDSAASGMLVSTSTLMVTGLVMMTMLW
ncbi:hypothetical protein BKA67DRAFT_517532 [Truncatella angustata]|uniref:Asl1-like glycosyl hydrolase catalytic domain-containing protein n=1 Tax=Truncatella angustata TaxID=152316 RepID=A0A9P8UL24_9PEZI|nr:uncharacterized protein BKA67DRAFT_517532 [Truncatella angustata]KAH6654148.1 hypothetical protein BKA67DRAFT_517532 [Truncatella angustata]